MIWGVLRKVVGPLYQLHKFSSQCHMYNDLLVSQTLRDRGGIITMKHSFWIRCKHLNHQSHLFFLWWYKYFKYLAYMEPSNKCNLWSTSLMKCLLPHLIFTNKAFSPCNNKYESLHNITRSTSNIRFFHINLFWIQTQTTKLGKCTVSSNSGKPFHYFVEETWRLLYTQKKWRETWSSFAKVMLKQYFWSDQ